MHHRAALVACVLFVIPVAAAEPPAPTGDGIVAPGAKLELLFTRTAPIKGGLTEGPAASPDGSIYFTDIPAGPDKGMILRFDPQTRQTTVFTDDSGMANGLEFDADGRLVACEGADGGGRRIVRWDVRTKQRQTVADRYEGKRFNSTNDLCIDRQGRIYFTDPRYVGGEPRELERQAVYRVERDGRVVEVTHEVGKPNGIGLSPDEKTLYVADHNNDPDRNEPTGRGAMRIYAFPLGPDGLVQGPRRTLVDFGAEAGCDGLTLDTAGRLYLTVRSLKRPGVLVIDPTGREVAFIPTGAAQPGAKQPAGIPSNVTFGAGAARNVLYVTVDTSLYRIQLLSEGRHRWEK